MGTKKVHVIGSPHNNVLLLGYGEHLQISVMRGDVLTYLCSLTGKEAESLYGVLTRLLADSDARQSLGLDEMKIPDAGQVPGLFDAAIETYVPHKGYDYYTAYIVRESYTSMIRAALEQLGIPRVFHSPKFLRDQKLIAMVIGPLSDPRIQEHFETRLRGSGNFPGTQLRGSSAPTAIQALERAACPYRYEHLTLSDSVETYKSGTGIKCPMCEANVMIASDGHLERHREIWRGKTKASICKASKAIISSEGQIVSYDPEIFNAPTQSNSPESE